MVVVYEIEKLDVYLLGHDKAVENLVKSRPASGFVINACSSLVGATML